jgi:dTDP-4-dehydrorhamnose reductase
MRVLVTGVTGQIGGALLPRLQGLHMTIPANRAVLDLAQPQAIRQKLHHLAPDFIINPAAYTGVDRAEDEPSLAMRVNGEAPGVIARWAADHGVPLIHFSTDYVFGGSGDRPWREEDEAHPLSVYGTCKLAGEDAIRAAGGSFLIIRTSWVYAATGSNFLRAIARRAQELTELRVVTDQIGAPTSAAIIADAVAHILGAGIDTFRSRSRTATGIVHLAAAGETSRHGFAAAVVDGLRSRNVALMAEHVLPITSDEYHARANRPRNSRLDLTRLQEIFNITTPHWGDALIPELDLLAADLRMPQR